LMTFNRQLPGLTKTNVNSEEAVAAQAVAFAGLADQRVVIRLKRGGGIGEDIRPRRAASRRRGRIFRRLLFRQRAGSGIEAGDVPVGRQETTVAYANRKPRRPTENTCELPTANKRVGDFVDAIAELFAFTERQFINGVGVDRMGYVEVGDGFALGRLPC